MGPQAGAGSRSFTLITHLHSRASDGAASPLYPYVQGGIIEAIGPIGAEVTWLESIITPKKLKRLLGGRYGRADLVCLTDHLSARLHRLRPEYMELAQQNENMLLGGEVSTQFWSAERGRLVEGPDILVYGPPAKRPGDAPYYGLTQADLDALYAAAISEGAREPDTLRVIDWVTRRGYAWAVAHPLDGNELTLPELFTVFARARAIEVLNGGFPEASHEALRRYLPLHNRVVRRPTDFGGEDADEMERQLAAALRLGTPTELLALGGSDAHISDFHRATTQMRVAADLADRPVPELFIRTLLGEFRGVVELTPHGHGTSWLKLYGEAARIVTLNFWKNRRYLAASLPRTTAITARIVKDRLSTYERLGQTRLHQIARLRLPPDKGRTHG